jgi:hypothetical protein
MPETHFKCTRELCHLLWFLWPVDPNPSRSCTDIQVTGLFHLVKVVVSEGVIFGARNLKPFRLRSSHISILRILIFNLDKGLDHAFNRLQSNFAFSFSIWIRVSTKITGFTAKEGNKAEPRRRNNKIESQLDFHRLHLGGELLLNDLQLRNGCS